MEAASRHPQQQYGIVSNVLRELTTRFEKFVKKHDAVSARRTLLVAMRAINLAEIEKYEDPQRLYCGSLFDAVFRSYVDGWDELFVDACNTLSGVLGIFPRNGT